ncbi:hypothetical protein MLD38_020423 [Melastoma candidum]|uniref:Uncharacterized protein n=1 Tax=Melastoma candidum TaxID=119954 RepID=A0ACB9QKX9_9MYRT|nr:hypothetical protein MLD38_020423 [Melastoma candidum]
MGRVGASEVAAVHDGVLAMTLETEVAEDLGGQQKMVHIEVTVAASSEDPGNKLEAETELGVGGSFETVEAGAHSAVDLVADA